ncbi:site-specific integrase [Magnetofaba australis]|uniref:site-specific integrase n=1 Tax=Magnetofaba australis TaxID=1472297 RepID=UPI001301AA6E|nr:site-specific integrase [Magnetofaba australis]
MNEAEQKGLMLKHAGGSLITPEEVEGRLAEYAQQARGAFSDNTVRAWRNDNRLFSSWCVSHGHHALPASGETVAAFVDAMAMSHAPASIRRYIASISAMHKAAGFDNPCAAQEVKLAVKRLNREKGTRQRQASPINRPVFDRLIEQGDNGQFRDARDVAMLAISYDTLCRRSELVAINVEDIEEVGDGSGTVLIRRSKTDQEGAGAVRYLAPDSMRTLKEWLALAKITEGAVFRGVDNANRLNKRLSAQGVARAFKRLADRAGVDAAQISGHSCRVGAAQDMVNVGLGLPDVMQAGGWKTPAMVARYTERQAAQRGAARKLATLQNRE